MGDLDKKLADYAALADRQPPGSPTRFAYQLGREYGLTQRVMDRVMERVAILPEDATLYDIQQVFTQLANGNVNYQDDGELQHLGGDMAFATDHVVHRCETCERLLPDNDLETMQSDYEFLKVHNRGRVKLGLPPLSKEEYDQLSHDLNRGPAGPFRLDDYLEGGHRERLE